MCVMISEKKIKDGWKLNNKQQMIKMSPGHFSSIFISLEAIFKHQNHIYPYSIVMFTLDIWIGINKISQ